MLAKPVHKIWGLGGGTMSHILFTRILIHMAKKTLGNWEHILLSHLELVLDRKNREQNYLQQHAAISHKLSA